MLHKTFLFLLASFYFFTAQAQELPFSGTKNKKAEYHFGEALKTFQLQDYDRTQIALNKAISIDPNFIDAYMMMAEMKKDNEKYDEAIALYNKIITINPEFPMSYFGRSRCYFMQRKFEEAFNDASKFMEFPDYYQKHDQIKTVKENANYARSAVNKPFPFTPINLGNMVNSMDNEYFPGITADEQILIFTRLVNGRDEEFYRSTKVDGKYTLAQNMGYPVNTERNEGTVSLSADGQYIFYTACNRPGAKGSCDLYLSKLDGNSWSEPINLGAPVNTASWESQPSLSFDGKVLYFSSNRPGTCIVIASNGKDAFMARDGADSKGGLDIYSFELYEEARPKKTGYAKGVVFDAITKKKLSARVELIDIATERLVVESYANKTSGEFLVCLQGNKNYALNVAQAGYLFYSENFALENQSATEPLVLSVPLQPITAGAKVVLKNIFFDSDKFELKPQSKAELNKLGQFLMANPTVKIEVGGHTDNTGEFTKNTNLSAKRALAVKTFLVNAGIDAGRLTTKGYADTQSLADNKTPEGRAQNRRTEIKIMP